MLQTYTGRVCSRHKLEEFVLQAYTGRDFVLQAYTKSLCSRNTLGEFVFQPYTGRVCALGIERSGWNSVLETRAGKITVIKPH